MNVLMPLQQKWHGLMPRERLIVLAGAGCVLLAVLWLIFDPLLTRRAEIRAGLLNIQEENQWMLEQAELLAQLGASCPQTAIAPFSANDFITRQAERNRLQLTSLQSVSGSRTRVQASTPDGNGALRLAHQLLCQGYSLSRLQIARTDAGIFTVTLEVDHGS